MRRLVQRLLHLAHDRLCPCRGVIDAYWRCEDCDMLNHPAYEWCGDSQCGSPSPFNDEWLQGREE